MTSGVHCVDKIKDSIIDSSTTRNSGFIFQSIFELKSTQKCTKETHLTSTYSNIADTERLGRWSWFLQFIFIILRTGTFCGWFNSWIIVWRRAFSLTSGNVNLVDTGSICWWSWWRFFHLIVIILQNVAFSGRLNSWIIVWSRDVNSFINATALRDVPRDGTDHWIKIRRYSVCLLTTNQLGF